MSVAIGFVIRRAGRRACQICKKPLSDPRSVEAGMGPVCRGHQNKKENDMDGTLRKQDFRDTFIDSIPFAKAFVMARAAGRPGDELDDREMVCRTNVPHLVTHHSPDGFEFGYGGSGAADLALNVCQHYLNLTGYTGRKTRCYDGNCWTLAWMLHQDFKNEFIASAPWLKGTAVSFDRMARWFEANITGALLNACANDEQEMIEEE